MCNLYSQARAADEIRRVFRAEGGGNWLKAQNSIYPDGMAPVIRASTDGGREVAEMRWGMPSPPSRPGAPITNVRNTASPHWRRWLKPENRCLVPVTSFCEWEQTEPKKTSVWFGLEDARPLFAFAGIWTEFQGVRGPKSAQVEGRHEVYGFLTCEANKVVGAIHPKAMPVLLTTEEDWETWLTAPWDLAKELQRPFPDAEMRIVGKGGRSDGLPT